MASEFPEFDLYEELEVSTRASLSVIQAAFRRLARDFHPDTVTDPRGQRMDRLNQAYEVLSDPARRGRYDFSRGQSGAAPGPDRAPGSGVAHVQASRTARMLQAATVQVGENAGQDHSRGRGGQQNLRMAVRSPAFEFLDGCGLLAFSS